MAKAKSLKSTIASHVRKHGTKKALSGEDVHAQYAAGLPDVPLSWQMFTQQDVFPLNTIIELHGPSDSAKTSLTLELGRWFIDHGGVMVFLLSENTFPEDIALSLLGDSYFDDEVFFYHPVRTTSEAQELLVTYADAFREYNADHPDDPRPALFVLDSLGALLPDQTKDAFEKKGYGAQTVAQLARAWSDAIADISDHLVDSGCTFVFINHEYSNIGYHGVTTSGGKKIKYLKTMEIRTRELSAARSSSNPEFVSAHEKLIEAKLKKHSSGSPHGIIHRIPFRWNLQKEFTWDWHFAFAYSLKQYLDKRASVGPARKIKKSKKKWSCKGLDLKDVSAQKLEEVFRDDEELYAAFGEEFGISRRPKFTKSIRSDGVSEKDGSEEG